MPASLFDAYNKAKAIEVAYSKGNDLSAYSMLPVSLQPQYYSTSSNPADIKTIVAAQAKEIISEAIQQLKPSTSTQSQPQNNQRPIQNFNNNNQNRNNNNNNNNNNNCRRCQKLEHFAY